MDYKGLSLPGIDDHEPNTAAIGQVVESILDILLHYLANRREAPRSPEGERRDESQGR